MIRVCQNNSFWQLVEERLEAATKRGNAQFFCTIRGRMEFISRHIAMGCEDDD